VTYWCLLHANQIPLCGFATKEAAAKYRAEKLMLDEWSIHYFNGRDYSAEVTA
jgi:hypothetical protein